MIMINDLKNNDDVINKPYIFISYCHNNSDIVVPLINHLKSDGYRVWYDSSIAIATEWDESIAVNLENSCVFLAFVSHEYLSSDNCKDELSYARNFDISKILVFIDDSELSKGKKMRFERWQAIRMNQYAIGEFWDKLYDAENFDKCKTNRFDLIGNFKIQSKQPTQKVILSKADVKLEQGQTHYIVPDCITEIEAEAFLNLKQLESISIPNSVVEIGGRAFCGCQNLRTIKLPNKLKVIRDGTFADCINLESIDIPNSLIRIGSSAFRGCEKLKKIVFPSGLLNIGSHAFDTCSSLTNIELPSHLHIDIGSLNCFAGCQNLKYIILHSENQINIRIADVAGLVGCVIIYPNSMIDYENYRFPDFGSLKSVAFSSIFDSENFYLSIDTAISFAMGQTYYKIPEGTVRLGFGMFAGCGMLENIIIPSSVKEIGPLCFSNCENIKEIDLSKNIERIGAYAFEGCSNLSAINVDEDNPHFCSNEGVLYKEDFKTLIQYPSKRKASTYILPNNVKKICTQAFYNCDYLKEIILPSGLENIESYAFARSSIEKISIPNSVSRFGRGIFYGCDRLEYAIFEGAISVIPKQTFWGCEKLKSFYVPQGVNTIEENAFSECASLKKINIPSTVQSIHGFSNSIEFDIDVSNPFYCNVNGVLYSKDKRILLSYFSRLDADIYYIQNGVRRITNGAFKNCKNLKEMVLPEGLEVIEDGAFSGSSIMKLSIPATVSQIGESICFGCSNLINVEIKGNISVIPKWAFFYCISIEELIIPLGIERIEQEAFGECCNLKKISIPSSVQNIDQSAFIGCRNLINVEIDPNNRYLKDFVLTI